MKKIAIIDDILPNALLIKGIAKRLDDVEPTIFTDPVEALRWCKENIPDLVMLDYHMPKMNGIEFLKEFRREENLRDTPVVIITGEEGKDVLYGALDAGATDLLRKPIDDVELIARAQNMLRLRARQLELEEANEKLFVMANTDALTGLANRRFFLKCLDDEFMRARRYRRPVSVAMIDADHFKKINDAHGHDVGDRVLRALADTIVRELRTIDRTGRIGGEEFAVYLPESDLAGAMLALERLRSAIADTRVVAGGKQIEFTVSMGVAELTPDTKTPAQLLKLADDMLYRAKTAGRNRVEAATGDVAPVETTGAG